MRPIPAADARLRSFAKHVVITGESKGIGPHTVEVNIPAKRPVLEIEDVKQFGS
jgi:hypothetical protein